MMCPSFELQPDEQALLDGADGPAMQLAMKLVVQAARIMAAPRLIAASFAHIDACFYAGQVHVDFARFLLENDAKFAVPTWTNNGLASLEKPELRAGRGDRETMDGARELMGLYKDLGARPVWTCAPYQLPGGPQLGDQIIAAESNAVCYYNSVVGARSNKYGDFLDVACALIGKVPFARLHTDDGRRGRLLIDTSSIPGEFKREDIFYHLLGYAGGRLSGSRVPVIDGLPRTANRDNLKAASAALAAAGGVELWHGIGVTPEAPENSEGFGSETRFDLTMDDLAQAREDLTTGRDGQLDMVALGTPHFSLSEFAALAPLLDGREVHDRTKTYVSTSRFIRDEAAKRGYLAPLEAAGVEIITDTCTYFTPNVTGCAGRAMTNAAKWAYYAPGMLGVEVCFGSLAECAESAVRGEVWRDEKLWRHLT